MTMETFKKMIKRGALAVAKIWQKRQKLRKSKKEEVSKICFGPLNYLQVLIDRGV
jgi:hypothetical protein